MSGARRPTVAEQLKAAKGARLEVSGARRPRGRRAAGSCGISARLEVSGARRPRGTEQLEAAEGERFYVSGAAYKGS